MKIPVFTSRKARALVPEMGKIVPPIHTKFTYYLSTIVARSIRARRPHTSAKQPMHARPTMQMTARAFCKNRAAARGWA